jgi:hypothetical protein
MPIHISALAHINRSYSAGPASPCKRIDPRTGLVIEVLTRQPFDVEKVKAHDWAHPAFLEAAVRGRKRRA